MITFLTVAYVLVCIALIVLVLLQRGKGAEIGAVFGGGGGATVFGSRGPATFLMRLTAVLAVLFMVMSGVLAYFGQSGSESTLFNKPAAAAKKAPPSPFEETPNPAQPAPGAAAQAPAGEKGSASPFKEVKPTPSKPAPAGKTGKPASP